ncbi:RNA methyltransferase, TrmA family [Alkaliphilus metalliredigens QYMF]|uniref:RNA methyltransferase, TrmA family n=1 Tax=Alkaliphilus metalliredigens (strain QYMF) TaxID=293826 RepID=A6TVC4_ALKMQ|nr:23S rRNA (uracil(1939)-C(5))-methyltransferase RlmD [Alkaliphilus metalliredigens]ABR50142.1 RNA methyltransferase, TrmA family [Alkaliphilus metalliredigens QYMF]
MINVNDVIEMEIKDTGHNGEGVGRIDGFTVFVEGGIPGDHLKVKITKVKKTYGMGRMIEIMTASPNRTEPRCPIADVCGGCQIMHMDYKGQLEMKRKRVEETLARIGKIETTVHATLGMDNPYEYRNKAQFPIGVMDGKAILGFYKKGSHEIVDTEYCHIQSPINETIAKVMKHYIDSFGVTVYDEKKRVGLLRHVITKVGFTTGEVMVVLITNGKQLPHKKELIDLLIEGVKGLKTVAHNINEKNTNVIFGSKTKTLHGEGYITDYIGDLKFNISPQSFFQVNPMQTKALYEKALEYANLTGEENVLDIYCGIGTISLFLAQKAKKVYGVEVVEAAIEDAKHNAKINNLNNAEFHVGKAEEVVPQLYKEGIRTEVVVVDPPRKGCEESVLETIVNMEPKRVVYVSCNPATLARDLAYLEEHGYKTQEVQPVDMFPHSSHVETVVLMSRVDK